MYVLYFIVISFFASLVAGTVGFGSSLITMPLILTFLAKEPALASTTIANVILNLFLIKKISGRINPKIGGVLFLASLIGMPIGIWILKTISMNAMKIFVGGLAIFFALIIYFIKIKLPKSVFLISLAGFCSGFLNTSTSMSGPPVVLLLMGQDVSKNEFRKTLATFFILLGLASLFFFFINQIITLQGIGLGFIAAPFVIFGAFLGDKMSKKLPQKLFKFLVILIVFFSGAYSIFSGLR